jgi:hypothetical protein
MVRRSGNAPDRSGTDSGFTDRLASLANYHREKLVDRRGYAPRTAGCKPADFLNNLAAQWLQGWDSNPRVEAYEASALNRLATLRRKWHGVSVLPRARPVLETGLRS